MELACDDQKGNPRRGEPHTCAEHIEPHDKTHLGPFTHEDLYVLVDFFYLPHKYGPLGVKVLQLFNWVTGNAPSQEALQKQSHVFEEVREDVGHLDELQGDVDPKVHCLCTYVHAFMHCMHVWHVCVHVCVRACVHACVRT